LSRSQKKEKGDLTGKSGRQRMTGPEEKILFLCLYEGKKLKEAGEES